MTTKADGMSDERKVDEFRPAFDMPRTAEEAIQVLEKWGKDYVMTFRARRAKVCAELLRAASLPSPSVVGDVMAEINRAVTKFPTWPTDPLHALGVVGEEFGELGKAVLQQVYEPHKNHPGDVRKEAVQTAAMAIRFLLSIDAYDFARGAQHEQSALAALGATP